MGARKPFAATFAKNLEWAGNCLLFLACGGLLGSLIWIAPARAGWEKKVDELSGLTYEALLKGDVPDDAFWEYVRPQRDYLRATFGPEVSTTYELHYRELARLDRPGPGPDDPRIIELKTLKRWPDPVVIYGRDLGELAGASLADLRLFACRLGRFVPIPYQFDEITPEGKKVLPDGGPEANPQEGNGLLDAQDEFVFMAHDAGDRVRPEQWLGGWDKAIEIALEDPKDKGKAWCYLLRFPKDPPPPSPLDYANYSEKYNQHYNFYVFSQDQFKVHGGRLYRQIFNHKWKIPDYAGGTFTNFIDRLKFRARVRLFFGSLKMTTTEDDVAGDTLALRDGPVRCNRRCWGQVILPLHVRTPKVVSDIIGYDTMFVCPVEISVPVNPGLVLTDFTMYSGTDLNESAVGGYWYNSNNLSGFLIDGTPAREEAEMNKALDQWRLVTGPWGTMMNRSIWDPEFMRQAKIRVEFTDDRTRQDPPEYVPGQIGMAYNYSTVENLAPGLYITELDWFFIPWFASPDRAGKLDREKVQAYLDMYEAPLLISTGGERFLNAPRPKGYHHRAKTR
jgi:hypothetical protein